MQSVSIWRRTAFISALLCMLAGISDRFLAGDTMTSQLFFSLPLLLLVYAVVTGRIRLLQWLGFVLMLVFIVCVLRLFSPGNLPLKYFTLLCCIFTFVAAVYFINRFQKSLHKAEAG